MFEQIGRFFVRRSQSWVFFLFLTVPFIVVLCVLSVRFFSLRDLEKVYGEMEGLSQKALMVRAKKEAFLSRYRKSDPQFLAHWVEPLELLSQKKEELRRRIEHPACTERAVLKKKLSDWEHTNNQMLFLEEEQRTSKRGDVRETEARLRRPVLVERGDLDRILSFFEHRAIGCVVPREDAPQFLIREFCLSQGQGGLFELDFSFLKREFYAKQPEGSGG